MFLRTGVARLRVHTEYLLSSVLPVRMVVRSSWMEPGLQRGQHTNNPQTKHIPPFQPTQTGLLAPRFGSPKDLNLISHSIHESYPRTLNLPRYPLIATPPTTNHPAAFPGALHHRSTSYTLRSIHSPPNTRHDLLRSQEHTKHGTAQPLLSRYEYKTLKIVQ